MRYKWKIEHRNAHQPEVAVVDFGAAVHLHGNAPRVELPLRMRQFACGDRSLAYQIAVGPVLLDNFSGKGKRIGGGKQVAGFAQPQSHSPDHAVERSRFRAKIVSAVTGLDVLVVRAAVQRDVALQFAVSRIRVVGDLIRAQDVSAIVNFHLAPQVVDRPILLLLHRPDRNLFFGLRLVGRGGRRSRGHNRGLGRSGDRRGGRGQRLAGYYPGSEKQMTDPGGRDKDSRADVHQRVIVERVIVERKIVDQKIVEQKIVAKRACAPPAVSANGNELTLARERQANQSSACLRFPPFTPGPALAAGILPRLDYYGLISTTWSLRLD